MNTDDLPEMAPSAYTSTSYRLGNDQLGAHVGLQATSGGGAQDAYHLTLNAQQWQTHVMPPQKFLHDLVSKNEGPDMPDKAADKDKDRLVRVVIADTNKSVPMERRVIYKSEEFYTDLSDVELYYEADVMSLLRKHNEYRTTLIDKATEGNRKERHLDPARVRDLHMAVVTIASF